MPKFNVRIPIKYEMELTDIEARNMDEAWEKAFKIAVDKYKVKNQNIDDWLVERVLGIEDFVEEVL